MQTLHCIIINRVFARLSILPISYIIEHVIKFSEQLNESSDNQLPGLIISTLLTRTLPTLSSPILSLSPYLSID